ncbi:Ankyrin repeat domain containing protein [Balamuthia mandrillaris]
MGEETWVPLGRGSLSARCNGGAFGNIEVGNGERLPLGTNSLYRCGTAGPPACAEVVERARENGCPWDPYTSLTLVKVGNLEAIQWAFLQENCVWKCSHSSLAARKGHLGVLKWAREHDFPWDAKTCANAAKQGNFELLQWAREHGCPWGEGTCSGAAFCGHLEMLQWARENGCPWDKETATKAAERGHLTLLKWAIKQGCPWQDEETCAAAAFGGQLEVLKWLHERVPLGRENLLLCSPQRTLKIVEVGKEEWLSLECTYLLECSCRFSP